MIKGRLFDFYFETAKNCAKLSYANRLKVGTVIVTKTGAMYPGFNGTIPGFVNNCENDDGSTNEDITIHSEQNALYKMLKEGVSAEGSTVFVTHSCCNQCSKMLISAGVERVVYGEQYRDSEPLDTLRKAGVIVEKYEKL